MLYCSDMTSIGNVPIDELGPVDCVLLSFPGNQFKGEIAPALRELVDSGTIHIIDLVFVMKSADGTVEMVELSEADPETAAHFDDVEGEVEELLNEEDLALAAEALEPNSSAMLLVWENSWARKVVTAMRNAGGEVIMQERIPHELVAAAVSAAGDTED
jgi:hypothetical protein